MAFYNIRGYLPVEKSADKQRNEQEEFESIQKEVK